MGVNAAREVADRLRVIRVKAESEAPLAACRALGQTAETAIKVTLTSSTHREGTRTPSKPGQPPSLVTGRLRRSVHRTTSRLMGAGVARCAVGTTLIYGPVHEFGPVTIHAGASGYLANRKTGQFFVVPGGRKDYVVIPRRPFIAPAVLKLETTGIAERVTSQAWRTVIDV